MAKIGLDYFPLNCQLDEKFELIEAEFGLVGFSVVVKLLQRIYGEHGYYCEWTNEVALLFSKRIGLGSNAVSEIVEASVRRGIFSKKLYEEYGVLSSRGIQKRYLDAVSRRKEVLIKKEYLLVNVDQKYKNVVITSENVDISFKDVDISKQSKVKKSRVKNSNKNNVQNDCTTSVSKSDINNLFESVWKLYPSKKGKGRVSDAKKKMLYELGYDTMAKCIERYKSELEKDKDWRKPQNGSTFFNSGYIDYLDENYVPCEKIKKVNSNSFNDFDQRNYTKQNMDDLEKRLLKKGNK